MKQPLGGGFHLTQRSGVPGGIDLTQQVVGGRFFHRARSCSGTVAIRTSPSACLRRAKIARRTNRYKVWFWPSECVVEKLSVDPLCGAHPV